MDQDSHDQTSHVLNSWDLAGECRKLRARRQSLRRPLHSSISGTIVPPSSAPITNGQSRSVSVNPLSLHVFNAKQCGYEAESLFFYRFLGEAP